MGDGHDPKSRIDYASETDTNQPLRWRRAVLIPMLAALPVGAMLVWLGNHWVGDMSDGVFGWPMIAVICGIARMLMSAPAIANIAYGRPRKPK
jgi:hypothetical protein